VFAADGIKIGRVADVSRKDGQIEQIHVATDSALGFGERIVTVPQPAFMIKGQMVLITDHGVERLHTFARGFVRL
jgi:hypothetical protein